MKIKILFVIWMGEWGGAEVALSRLLKSLNRELFQPHAWIFKPGPLVEFMRAHSVPVQLFFASRFLTLIINPVFHWKFFYHLKIHRIQIVHANGTLAYAAAYWPCRFARVPLLWGLVDLPEGKDRGERFAANTKPAMILCNSQATVSAFAETYPKNSSPRDYVYPAVEIPVAKQNPEAEKKNLIRSESLPENAMLILSASRMQRWKGMEVLVKAIPIVLKKNPAAYFIFAGTALSGMEDGTESNLKKLADELGVRDHCLFPGFKENIGSLMEASDIVVHTALKPEPFGLVIAEAMAHAKAVIATNQGGPLEIIDSDMNGLLIEPGRPDILAEAILSLLQNPQRRRSLGEAGRQKILSSFQPSALCAKAEGIYRSLLGEAS